MRDIQKFFEEHADDFLKLPPRAPELCGRPDLIAFMLLDKLVPSTIDIVSAADHDIIYLSVDPYKVNGVATDAELLLLIQCGVMFEAEQESFSMFV